ncbi:hypothetical protein NDK47_09350 [Brevibacillus ruminantium]|uniref:Transposase n=1 Tax=Brevibacillus ruminantium TaxID=2950604 RepID=A0ABY4WPY1_9BACL|nr:hypothetical protein [Brevibacillus ruminantium]USG67459.1 hypothetical protein NDK47_09350 [Brevibacillus ruminantium]
MIFQNRKPISQIQSEERDTPSAKVQKLEQENRELMLAVTELYEMLLAGKETEGGSA